MAAVVLAFIAIIVVIVRSERRAKAGPHL
jgi:hypothetical protein